MQIRRTASAIWNGSGKEGQGVTSTQSGVLDQTAYSYKTRFEDGIGTNPEELIASAHASCFSMKLAFVLQAAGITADTIETHATVILENGAIPAIELKTKVKAAGISAQQLHEYTTEAKNNCPVSKLLNAEIRLEAELVN